MGNTGDGARFTVIDTPGFGDRLIEEEKTIVSGYSVREVLKNSTPHPSSRGEGGLDPPESQPSPKSLNFLLILYFSRSFLEHVG